MQRHLSAALADGSEVYRVLDTTLVPAIVRVRARHNGLFAGQASFGRSVSKTEWAYGFKVALSVSPEGVVTAFGLAPANCEERKVGEFLVRFDGHDTYLADKGFSSVWWERTGGGRSTGLWWRPPQRRTHIVLGPRRLAGGRPASGRSSRGGSGS